MIYYRVSALIKAPNNFFKKNLAALAKCGIYDIYRKYCKLMWDYDRKEST